MESVGTLADGEYWSALCGMPTEEADFMAQLLGSCALPGNHHEQDEIVPSFGNSSSFSWPSHEPSMGMGGGDEKTSYYYPDDTVNINPNLQNYLPQGSSHSGSSISSFCFPTSSHKNYYITDSNQMFATNNNGCLSMDISMVDVEQTNSSFPDNLMEEPAVGMNQEMSSSSTLGDAVLDQKSQPKRKFEMPKPDLNPKDKNNRNPIDTPKGRCQVQRNKRNADSKKNQQKLKAISNDEEEAVNIAGLNGQGSSSCSSEDDSNASQELNGGETSSSKGSASLNSNGKARASRGSATDPQSLYARKRRERINERLKVLQNLVPNGTKVDISTMLEEAAQYVKFLQLQIKLLSSDDLWMYAPIAYNGMDVGLDLKISPSR